MPDVVLGNLELERALENVERKRARGDWLGYFDQQLRELDSKLSLVKARDDAPAFGGMVPGFWHVRRANGGGIPDSYLPITDENGGFIEPHSGILEGLRANDLQRAGRLDELRKEWDRRDADREKSMRTFRDDFRDEFLDRYKAHSNPGVLFGDNRWTYRAGARKAA